jgi:hypothetical protein
VEKVLVMQGELSQQQLMVRNVQINAKAPPTWRGFIFFKKLN